LRLISPTHTVLLSKWETFSTLVHERTMTNFEIVEFKGERLFIRGHGQSPEISADEMRLFWTYPLLLKETWQQLVWNISD
jgi:hypothetical protein